MSEAQYQRLLVARKTHKYGHLQTWEELYFFQKSTATLYQIKEIAEFAKRYNSGDRILLPLMKNLTRSEAVQE